MNHQRGVASDDSAITSCRTPLAAGRQIPVMESRLRAPRIRLAGLFAALSGVVVLGVAPPPRATDRSFPALQYDLRPGDHLVYRETLERRVSSEQRASTVRAEWRNHLVVMDSASAATVCVGVQRNRVSAELVSQRENGRDRTAAAQARFRQQMAERPPVTVESNCFTPDGRPLLPTNATREWTSLALIAFREIEPLPNRALAIGEAWEQPNLLGFHYHAAGCKPAAPDCVTLEGTSPMGRSVAWFSTRTRLLTRLEFKGDYLAPPSSRVQEQVAFELASQTRGEDKTAWLDDPLVQSASRAAQAIRVRPPAGTRLRAATTADIAGWPYVLHVPDDYRGDRPFPLLVYLGGGPGLAVQAAQLLEEAVAPLHYLVLYPNADGMWWDDRRVQMVRALVDETLRSFKVDTNRVYLAGFSNGGTGALYYATLWPDRFAAVAPTMAASLNPDTGDPMLVANLRGLPLLLLHGDKDPVIPISHMEAIVKQVRRDDPATLLQTHVFPGRPHDVWLGNDEGLSASFLGQHVRNPFPPHVTFEARTASTLRRNWIEIVEKSRGTAHVEGTLGEDGTITLTARNVRRLSLLLRPELVSFSRPVRVVLNGREAFNGMLTESHDLFQQSLRQVADPYLAWSAQISLDVR